MENILEPMTLKRIDGKVVDVTFYNNSGIEGIEILDIKKLKFEGMPVKNIKKSQIHEEVLKGEDKIYLTNNHSQIVAGLSKKHLNKIISTIFTRDIESRHAYLKKELISNVDLIFHSAIPIMMHPELKKQALYHNQVIHRFALPLKIGGTVFLTMITVKERTDYKEMLIDEFSIYDLYSEAHINRKSSGSSSTVSKRTFRSHYQMNTIIIYDLIEFVKCCVQEKY